MLLVKIGDVDYTEYVKLPTLSRTQQLNNRSDTLKFSAFKNRPLEQQRIDIWEYTRLAQDADGGDIEIFVEELFTESKKLMKGMEIRFGDGQRDDEWNKIADIDYEHNKITLERELNFTLVRSTKVLVRFFAGEIRSITDKQEGKFYSNARTYSISCVDYKYRLDRENIQEIFINKYMREIMGRILYEFVSTDNKIVIEPFETARTPGGVADPMTPDHDDRISGNYSMATSTDGAGKATRTKTIPTTDISGHTHLRFRRKIAKDEGYKMRAMKVRIGQDEDNYLEWNIEKIGSEYEDCRNWESVWLYKNATEIGEVDLTLCRRIQIEIDASADIHLNDIHFDEMSATTGSFTLGKAIRGSYKFKDVRINHRKPSDVIEDLAKMQGDFRYVDYEGEINYFTKQGEDVAAIEVSPDNQEFGSLSIAVDTIDLKNRQYVVGSEAPEPILYTQDEVSDGEETSRRLDYKPSGLKVFVSTNTGSSRDERTVGVEGLNKPEDFDFLFNFNEKIVKLGATGFIVNSGDIFRRQYFPYKPISYRFADLNSIAKMKSLTGGNGVFDGPLIIDKQIDTHEEAFMRAKSEVDLYKNPQVTVNFLTNVDNLKVGDFVKVVDPSRELDETYLIQKISAKQKAENFREYTVSACSSLFGITEFLQLLLKRSVKLYVDEEAIVYIVVNVDETISLLDELNLEIKPNVYKTGTIERHVFRFLSDFGSRDTTGEFQNRHTKRNATITDGKAEFIKDSAYNDHSALQLSLTDRATSAVSVISRYRYKLNPNADYRLTAWIKKMITDTETGAEIKVVIHEYAQRVGGTEVATQVLTDTIETHRYRNIGQTFIATGSRYELEFVASGFEGVVEFGNVWLEDMSMEVIENVGVADFAEAS